MVTNKYYLSRRYAIIRLHRLLAPVIIVMHNMNVIAMFGQLRAAKLSSVIVALVNSSIVVFGNQIITTKVNVDVDAKHLQARRAESDQPLI